MDGINLFQAAHERKGAGAPKSFLDKGFVIAATIFFSVAAVWGGLLLYTNSVDGKINAISASVQTGLGSISGKSADRVGDFSDRLSLMEAAAVNAVEPGDVLDQLGRMTVQGVVLTDYEYDVEHKAIRLEGETDNFRYIGQQMFSMKLSGSFSSIIVSSIEKKETGLIQFVLKADIVAAAKSSVVGSVSK